MMPRYNMDAAGYTMDLTGTWNLHIESEVLNMIKKSSYIAHFEVSVDHSSISHNAISISRLNL